MTETHWFDTVHKSVARSRSRREAARSLALLLPFALPRLTEAKQRKTAEPNAFGCLPVGQKCRGKNSKCCSGICQGKKPKKGKKDKSRCVGHDGSTCRPGQHTGECGGVANIACTTSVGLAGSCATTTGNAAYCLSSGECFPCTRDADCQAVCGPQAACIQCATECVARGGTACMGIETCTF
jgi:hypothetical protein